MIIWATSGIDWKVKILFHIAWSSVADALKTLSCLHITASTICLDHKIIKIHIAHHKIIHHAFFLAASSVEITKVMTLIAIMMNKTHVIKYNATLIKGYIILVPIVLN